MKNDGKPLKYLIVAILLMGISGCLSRPEEKAPSSSAASTFADNIEYGAFVDLGSYEDGNGTPDHYLHKAGYVDWTTGDVINDGTAECKILSNNFSIPDSNTYNQQSDIVCFLEANELDLAFYGAKIEVGFQPGMCEFVKVKPYWYWNFPPGTSSATVTQAVLGDETTQCIADQRAAPLNQAIYGTGDTRDYATYTNATDAIENAKDLCLFDWSNRTNLTGVDEDEAPNCDDGRVTLIKSTCQDVEDEDNNVTCECSEPTSQTVDCGGSWANCIAGPAKDYATSNSNFPVPLYRNSLEDGYLSRFDLGNTDAQLIGQSYSIRNLANWTRTATNEDDEDILNNGQQWYPSLLPQTIRYNVHKLRDYASRGSRIIYSREEALTALQTTIDGGKNLTGITDTAASLYAPISMINVGTGGDFNPPGDHGATLSYTMGADPRQSVYKDGITPNPFYTWECLNRAEEVKARIRIIIRPWNETFNTVDASVLSRVFPLDTSNYHRADTGFKEDIPIFSTADFYDWDDAYEFGLISSSNLGDYDTDQDFDDFSSTFAPVVGGANGAVDAPYWKDNVCYNSNLDMNGAFLTTSGGTCLRYDIAEDPDNNGGLFHQHQVASNIYFENLRLEWPDVDQDTFNYPRTSNSTLEEVAREDQYPYVNSVPPGYDFLLGFSVRGDLPTAYDTPDNDQLNVRASLGANGSDIEGLTPGTGTSSYPFTAPRYYEARFNFPLVIGIESEFTEKDILDKADDEDDDGDDDDEG